MCAGCRCASMSDAVQQQQQHKTDMYIQISPIVSATVYFVKWLQCSCSCSCNCVFALLRTYIQTNIWMRVFVIAAVIYVCMYVHTAFVYSSGQRGLKLSMRVRLWHLFAVMSALVEGSKNGGVKWCRGERMAGKRAASYSCWSWCIEKSTWIHLGSGVKLLCCVPCGKRAGRQRKMCGCCLLLVYLCLLCTFVDVLL